jgi:uncharacterized membrane protein YhaH (DUF805 family)
MKNTIITIDIILILLWLLVGIFTFIKNDISMVTYAITWLGLIISLINIFIKDLHDTKRSKFKWA